MKKISVFLSVLFATFVISTVLGVAFALAQATAPVVSDPSGALSALLSLVNLVKDHNWTMAVSVGIMLLVYVYTTFIQPKLGASSRATPFIAVGVGILVQVATSLASGGSFMPALLHGVVTGVAASGFWELLSNAKAPAKPATPVA